MEKMKVLIIADEVWNDRMYGNNVLSSWFEGFNAEIAHIYCSPGHPLNKCCKKYFQITDMMMFKSLFSGEKAGMEIILDDYPITKLTIPAEEEHKKLYTFLKSITTESLRALRDFLWLRGKYDEDKLRKFIEQFNPDIIFCPRKASSRILRLERIVAHIANKPMVAFTGDDEYSLRQLRFSPVYWLRRFRLRSDLRKNMKLYSLYYTYSEEQGEEYRKIFKIRTKFLFKCSDFSLNMRTKVINKPIKLVYAGKLYCNRWKTLVEITKALKKINENETKMILEIYTKDKLSKQQKKLLGDGINSFVKEPVSSEDLKNIYKNSDIALHVESFDLKNRLLTKYSFSNKIVDCLSSSCAVMAICWKNHSGYKYLEKEDAAICIDDIKKVYEKLAQIAEKPENLKLYAEKAYKLCEKNHKKSEIQYQIESDFQTLLRSNV